MVTGPAQADVDGLRELLDLLANFSNNDQRARYILSSNWMRDRDGQAGLPRSEVLPVGSSRREEFIAVGEDARRHERDIRITATSKGVQFFLGAAHPESDDDDFD